VERVDEQMVGDLSECSQEEKRPAIGRCASGDRAKSLCWEKLANPISLYAFPPVRCRKKKTLVKKPIESRWKRIISSERASRTSRHMTWRRQRRGYLARIRGPAPPVETIEAASCNHARRGDGEVDREALFYDRYGDSCGAGEVTRSAHAVGIPACAKIRRGTGPKKIVVRA